MVVTCDIQFENNPEATFYAGQVITGKVTLQADKIKQVKAVTLKINGSAKTRWSEKGSQNKSDTTYCGQVDYMNTVTCLLAPNATDQAVLIEPGIHTFNFACHIPANCPSSYESIHGQIRYIIQISLARPWKFDQNFTRGFTVLTIKNLNYDSPLLKPNSSPSLIFLFVGFLHQNRCYLFRSSYSLNHQRLIHYSLSILHYHLHDSHQNLLLPMYVPTPWIDKIVYRRIRVYCDFRDNYSQYVNTNKILWNFGIKL